MSKTILNKNFVDPKTQPLFCGESLSLQRYDDPKWPVFVELYEKQNSFFWSYKEISLIKDRSDFQKLTPNEQFIFTSNLQYQILLDSVISRGVPSILEHVSNPELEACLTLWQSYEVLHSYSYSYIIKNVYSNPGEVFDAVLKIPEIMARAKGITECYDKLINATGDVREQLYLTLINVNILEGLRFYVSFVCSFSFGQSGRMVGNSENIKLIKRDESLHLYTSQQIINALRTVESEGFVEIAKRLEPQVIELFKESVKEEQEWAKFLFKDGSMIGLNSEILGRYVEYLADTRMAAIGLPKLYKTKNPLGWTAAWLGDEDGTQVQTANQEHENSQYLRASTNNDIDNCDFSDLM